MADPRGGSPVGRAAWFPDGGGSLKKPLLAICALAAALVLAVLAGTLWRESKTRGRSESAAFHLSCPDPGASAVEIVNRGPRTARFRPALNGRPFVQSLGEMAEEVVRPLGSGDGEGHARAVWRYTWSQFAAHKPLSERGWYSHPCLVLNSTGFGYCDEAAEMNYGLWRQLGYPSRIWRLNGHVVSEVRVGERWEMYDSDLGVCYGMPGGRVAGVEDLSRNPGLVFNSAVQLEPPTARGVRFARSQVIAEAYATRADNEAAEPPLPAPLPFEILLPPGGSVRFPLPASAAIGGRADPVPEPEVAAFLELRLPGGWSGELALPLILRGAEGDGEIGDGWRWYGAGSEPLARVLRSERPPHGAIRVRSRGPLTLLYYVNPRRFRLAGENEVALAGKGLEGVSARLVESTREPEDPQAGPAPGPAVNAGASDPVREKP